MTLKDFVTQEYFGKGRHNSHIVDLSHTGGSANRPRNHNDPSTIWPGAHQWALATLLNVNTTRLEYSIRRVIQQQANFNSFEDIFELSTSWCGRFPGVGFLTSYDIALRIAWLILQGGGRTLMPLRYVYIQPKLGKALAQVYGWNPWQWWFRANGLEISQNAFRIPVGQLPAPLNLLAPWVVEDILCEISKSQKKGIIVTP